jgi:hypothetical protein
MDLSRLIMAAVASTLSGEGRASKKSKSTAKGLGGEGHVQIDTRSAMTSHTLVSVENKMYKDIISKIHYKVQ